jgi:hypothetical protein
VVRRRRGIMRGQPGRSACCPCCQHPHPPGAGLVVRAVSIRCRKAIPRIGPSTGRIAPSCVSSSRRRPSRRRATAGRRRWIRRGKTPPPCRRKLGRGYRATTGAGRAGARGHGRRLQSPPGQPHRRESIGCWVSLRPQVCPRREPRTSEVEKNGRRRPQHSLDDDAPPHAELGAGCRHPDGE